MVASVLKFQNLKILKIMHLHVESLAFCIFRSFPCRKKIHIFFSGKSLLSSLQVANSNHTIDPERIRSLVKKYVAKYKGSRERRAKKHSDQEQEIPFTFSP